MITLAADTRLRRRVIRPHVMVSAARQVAPIGTCESRGAASAAAINDGSTARRATRAIMHPIDNLTDHIFTPSKTVNSDNVQVVSFIRNNIIENQYIVDRKLHIQPFFYQTFTFHITTILKPGFAALQTTVLTGGICSANACNSRNDARCGKICFYVTKI